MAQFIPSIEKIQQFRIQPTEGEWHLLRFLESTLDDSFEVYFNPFLNGDRTDVVIMRKGGGVIIIEVKDWDLSLYTVDDRKHYSWVVGAEDKGHQKFQLCDLCCVFS